MRKGEGGREGGKRGKVLSYIMGVHQQYSGMYIYTLY